MDPFIKLDTAKQDNHAEGKGIQPIAFSFVFSNSKCLVCSRGIYCYKVILPNIYQQKTPLK